MQGNYLILNNIDIGISKIELDKSDLIITDKSHKFCLKICVLYNWREINSINIGEKKEIDFNEYYLSLNNETALISPSTCYVEKITNDKLCFYFKFDNLSSDIHYMNKRGFFNVELHSLEANINVDYKDVSNHTIVYNF